MFFSLIIGTAFAQDVTVQNDTAFSNSFGLTDMVAWLEYPECVVSVLTPDSSDLPMDVHTIQVYLGSQFGTLDNIATSLMMGIQIIGTNETPAGYGNWDWPITLFNVTVSSTQLNLNMLNPQTGSGSLLVNTGSIAVWICAPDPSVAVWPYDGFDLSGVVLHTNSPSDGTYVYDGASIGPVINPLTSMQQPGSWIIRAVGTPQTTSSQPASEPTAEPESEPSSEPESQPTSEPENEPSSEPESQPTSEPTAEHF